MSMLSTCPHQCRRQVHQSPSICYHVCVIMHVKDPWLSVERVRHHVPLAGFCLSLYSLHVLNRDLYMIQTNKNRCITIINAWFLYYLPKEDVLSLSFSLSLSLTRTHTHAHTHPHPPTHTHTHARTHTHTQFMDDLFKHEEYSEIQNYILHIKLYVNQ